MKKLLVFICLALCMMLLVCSCGGNTDTDTNTESNTDTASDSTVLDTNSDTTTDTDTDNNTPDDSDIIINDELYKVFVCDEDGNGIAGAFVQFCKDTVCDFGETDANGYLVVPSGEYHVALVLDQSGTYPQVTYDESNYPSFEGDSKVITIILTK